MDDELECHADGRFEYEGRDGYLDELDGGIVGVDDEGSDAVDLNVKVADGDDQIYVRAMLDAEQAREVGEWLLDYAED